MIIIFINLGKKICKAENAIKNLESVAPSIGWPENVSY